jgi:cation transporter-like permease
VARPDNGRAWRTSHDSRFVLGTLEPVIDLLFSKFGKDEIYEGDIFASNSPHESGSHLNDIAMVKPVFVDGRLIAFVAVWAVFGNFAVGLGVAISLFAGGTLASAIGLLLPWALSRVDIDPAFGSGPVATIVQDALTILVYFLVMTKLLS